MRKQSLQKNRVLNILGFLILAIWSCTEESIDTTPPSITIVDNKPVFSEMQICGERADNVFKMSSSDTLRLTVDLRDNENLSELKLDIHQNFDCHGHGGQAPSFNPPNLEGTTLDWTVLEVKRLEGTEERQRINLIPPANVTAGNYHFGMQVLDLNGNQSNQNIYNIQIQNLSDTMSPSLNLVTNVEDLRADKGSQVSFDLEIYDDQPLNNGGNGVVFLSYKQANSSIWNRGANRIFENNEPNLRTTLQWDIPNTLTSDTYDVLILAHDGVRNISNPIAFELIVD